MKYLVFAGIFLHCTSILSQDASPWFVTDSSYNEMLSQAIRFQSRADSLMDIAFGHRKEILYMADSEKKGHLQVEVTRIEREAKQLQEWADDIFGNLPVPGVEEPAVRNCLIIVDTVINDIKVYRYNLPAMAALHDSSGTVSDDGKPEPGKEPDAEGEVPSGKNGSGSGVKPGAGENHFLINKECPYSEQNPFEHEFTLPEGPFYRIQLAAYGNPVGYDFFGGISPITTGLTEKGITRYYAGKFVSFGAAQDAIKRLRALGYEDAFIVGYFNGQRMAPDRVLEYEKNNK